MRIAVLALLPLAFALPACSTNMSDEVGPAATAMAEMPTDARGFAMMAASSDMFEINSSRLALDRGVTGDVRDFAQMMITDHTRTSGELANLLANMQPAMTPPKGMMAPHEAMLDRLEEKDARGADFARAYLDAQVTAHQQAVALFETYAARGDNPVLRQWASTTLPALRMHLQRAQSLRGTA